MPKRGGRKKFSTPEEIEAQRKELEMLALASKDATQNGDSEVVADAFSSANKIEEDAEDDEENTDEEEARAKGVSHLIAVQNPNYVKTKSARKLDEIDPNEAKPVLTRREREEIEAQRLAAEAEAALIKQEMETLFKVRQEREKERAKAEAERKVKEVEKARKAAEMQAKMQQKLFNKQNKGRKVNQQKLAQQLEGKDKNSKKGKEAAPAAGKAKPESCKTAADRSISPFSSQVSHSNAVQSEGAVCTKADSPLENWDDDDNDDVDDIAFG